MGTAVLTEGLTKRYRGRGGRLALNGFDLAVADGTVHGLLGPNGAGKTTAVRILTTLLRPDAGRAIVAGHDVVAEPARVRRRIGLVGQHPAVDEVLDGRANLVMFGRLYHLSCAEATRRADALLERFELTDTSGRPVERYCAGRRPRRDHRRHGDRNGDRPGDLLGRLGHRRPHRPLPRPSAPPAR